MNFSSVINGVWWTLAEFLMNFGILCAHFGTVGSTEHWVTVPKCAHKIPKFIQNSVLLYLIFGRHLRKIGICFGNRPIADFFHDQIIFLKDYEHYTIGHSLAFWIPIIPCTMRLRNFCWHSMAMGNLNKSKETTPTTTTAL